LTPGLDFSFLFAQPGVYSYHCIYHPSVMIGSVIVAGTVEQTYLPFVNR
jgi:plastocyanin